MFPAIFLDRDGVIVENRQNYIRSWSDVHIFPQALDALVQIKSSPHKIIIVTNQSAVGRGIMPLSMAISINRQLLDVIQAAGGRIDGVYMCPHAPQDKCSCRKPRPGLLLQAVEELSVDVNRSILVGDALTDLLAGRAAGVKWNVLLRTGRGAAQETLLKTTDVDLYRIYDTLSDALKELV